MPTQTNLKNQLVRALEDEDADLVEDLLRPLDELTRSTLRSTVIARRRTTNRPGAAHRLAWIGTAAMRAVVKDALATLADDNQWTPNEARVLRDRDSRWADSYVSRLFDVKWPDQESLDQANRLRRDFGLPPFANGTYLMLLVSDYATRSDDPVFTVTQDEGLCSLWPLFLEAVVAWPHTTKGWRGLTASLREQSELDSDACLLGVLRGLKRASQAGNGRAALEAVSPTAASLHTRLDLIQEVLESPKSSVVKLGLSLLSEAHSYSDVDAPAMGRAVRVALEGPRPDKALGLQALTLLDSAMNTAPDDPDVRDALGTLQSHPDASVADRARALLKSAPADADHGPPAPLWSSPPPAPDLLTSPLDLVDFIAERSAKHTISAAFDQEIVLDALTRMSDDDMDRVMQTLTASGLSDQISWAQSPCLEPLRQRALKSRVTRPLALWRSGDHPGLTGLPVGVRSAELAHAGQRPHRLVATPAAVSGHVDPDRVLSAIADLDRDGIPPLPSDLEQARLRLPRDLDPAWGDQLERQTGPSATAFRALLRQQLGEPLLDQRWTSSAIKHWSLPNSTRDLPSWAAGLPTLGSSLTSEESPVGRAIAWRMTDTAPRLGGDTWLATPSHRELVAARFITSPCEVRVDEVLMLAHVQGPLGLATGQALASAATDESRQVRRAAAEVVAQIVASPAAVRAESDPLSWCSLVGRNWGSLARYDRFTPQRLTHFLNELIDLGAANAAAPLAVGTLRGALHAVFAGRPGLAALFATTARSVTTCGYRAALPELDPIADSTKKSETRTQARTLRDALSRG